jgi:uncharacterized protein (TIGR03435 family)
MYTVIVLALRALCALNRGNHAAIKRKAIRINMAGSYLTGAPGCFGSGQPSFRVIRIGVEMSGSLSKVVTVVCFLAAAAGISGRSGAMLAAGLPAFDVASVKRAAPGDRSSAYRTSGGVVSLHNFTLAELLVEAYGVKSYQIAGPRWVESKELKYVVEARYPADTPKDQVRPMLQALLAERFGLKTHRETKELPVYALMTDGRLTKLKKAGEGSDEYSNRGYIAGAYSMSDLADELSDRVERPVLDRTALAGTFEIELRFTPDDLARNEPQRNDTAGSDSRARYRDRPSLFTAMQEQLGLRLVAKKARIELVVVDHAERTPTEN